MYRVLCVGDTHFKSTNKVDTDALRKAVLEKVDLHKPDLIVLLGDILDNGKSIYPPALYDSIEFIYSLSEKALTYVLVGNHDMINNQQFLTPIHPFTGIRENPRIKIVSKLETLVVDIISSTLLFLPYVPPGRFMEALDNTDLTQIRCIFCHQEFKGAALTANGTKLSTNGDAWDKENPFIISGHIHTYARLQSNILYVGTPMQVDFGDISKKHISLFTFNENNKGFPSEEHIFLNLRTRRVVHVSVSEAYRWEDLDSNIIWKLYIDGTTSEINRFLRSNKSSWLEKQGVTVLPGNAVQETSSSGNSENINYTDIRSYKLILQESTDKDVHQREWLDKIFYKYNI